MSEAGRSGAFEKLRRFVRSAPPAERCEMCSTALGREHQHLVELASRKMVCACDSCAILFTSQTRYKRVPRRVRYLENFQLTDSQWDGMLMPINLAFFFRSTAQGRVVAMYPSPGGATESLLPLETWDEIVNENPVLQELETDVEALLVNRIGHSRGFTRPEYYLGPIDECYKLVGLIRGHWQGLSGGAEVWQEIARFFTELRLRSPVEARAAHTQLSAELHA
jgi:hypothetical protein